MNNATFINNEIPKDQLTMIELFKDNLTLTSLYKKVGTVQARLAKSGEEIVTIIDGHVETKNVAKTNDVIVKGLKGEEYIIGYEKFKTRYALTTPILETFTPYEPTGTCIAFEYKGDSMVFTAPWNEDMIVHKGDFLATIDPSIPEVYRIERDAFYKTYQKIGGLQVDDESVILSTN